MNRYAMIRRLRGPAYLLLVGVIALLNRLGWVERPWGYFCGLALILTGALMLAERAALSQAEEAVAEPVVETPVAPAPAAVPEPPAEPQTIEGEKA